METTDNNCKIEPGLQSVLKQLISCIGLSVNALAKALNLPTPTINRLLTGDVQDPRASTLLAIADYFSVSVDQLLGREILPEKFQQNRMNKLSAKPPNTIPLLSMTEAVNYEESCKKSTNWLRWQSQSKSNGDLEKDALFSVIIKNNLYEPIFIAGSFIIVNPFSVINSGDYVLVKFTNDTIAVIKKYVSEGEYKYLYSLKPEVGTINFDKNKCTILGVIIEAYVNFKN